MAEVETRASVGAVAVSSATEATVLAAITDFSSRLGTVEDTLEAATVVVEDGVPYVDTP